MAEEVLSSVIANDGNVQSGIFDIRNIGISNIEVVLFNVLM
jgi:hypothetical protein